MAVKEERGEAAVCAGTCLLIYPLESLLSVSLVKPTLEGPNISASPLTSRPPVGVPGHTALLPAHREVGIS